MEASPAAKGGGSSNIRVVVRIRPFLPIESGSKSCVSVATNGDDSSPIGQSVQIGPPDGSSGKKQSFTFDRAVAGVATQKQVYEACVSSLIENCIDGYNATTLAYGQTGAGKTYTILGPTTSAALDGTDDEVENSSIGVIPRALRDLFQRLCQKRDCAQADSPYKFEVKIQFLELYGEEIRDLLSSVPSGGGGGGTSNSSSSAGGGGKKKLAIREKGSDSEVVGATSVPVTSAADALLCLTKGMMKRVVAATAMNAESSRSHAIMTVLIKQTIGPADCEEVKKSKFNFVDLAGSERQKRTGAKGKRLKEGIDINKGLLVLGNVISALGSADAKKQKFVPFRDSKLTRLLRGSLGGNHCTLMVACVSPSAKNLEESLNCLRYANRAKNIKNDAKKNVASGHAKIIADLKDQVQGLATELIILKRGGSLTQSKFDDQILESLLGKDGAAILEKLPKNIQHQNQSNETQKEDDDEMRSEVDRLKQILKTNEDDMQKQKNKIQQVESERDGLVKKIESLERAMQLVDSNAPKLDIDQDTLTSIVEHIASFDARRSRQKGISWGETSTTEEEETEADDYSLGEEDDISFSLSSQRSFADDSTEDALDHPIAPTNPTAVSALVAGAESATVLYCTAVVLAEHAGPPEEALKCLQIALELRRKIFGWEHPSVGDVLHMEGLVRAGLREHDHALLLLYDALRIRKESDDSGKVTSTLRAIGDVHVSREEYMHAELFYEECLLHEKEVQGYNDESIPQLLIDLAHVKMKLDHKETALQYFEEAVDVWSMKYGPDSQRCTSLYCEIWSLAFQLGDVEKGERCLNEFIALRQQKNAPPDAEIANALFTLGNLNEAKKVMESAHYYWSMALQIYHFIGLPPDHPCIVAIQAKIARVSSSSGGLAKVRRQSEATTNGERRVRLFGRWREKKNEEEKQEPALPETEKDL